LAPLGADPAAVSAASMTSRGTGSSLNARQLRRDCIVSLNACARAMRSASDNMGYGCHGSASTLGMLQMVHNPPGKASQLFP
jgi:hypothetical protein